MLSTRSRTAISTEKPPPSPVIGLIEDGIPTGRHPETLAFLPEARRLGSASPDAAARIDAVAVLAGSPLAALAATHGVPAIRLAEGFLRAPRFGARAAPRLSLAAVERAGPPEPAPLLQPAAAWLAIQGWETPALIARARTGIDALLAARVGADWWSPAPDPALLAAAPAGLVVLGRHLGHDGGAPCACFDRLLDAALDSTAPDRLLLMRPAGLDGKTWRRAAARATALGCRTIETAVDPWPLLDKVERVYTTDHEIGFLALLCGRTVHCFGDGFYAGWGATQDRDVPARPRRRTVEEIFAAACLLATRYADPFSGRAWDFEDALALAGDWRRTNDANRRIAVCVGMSFWKRRRVGEFLASSDGPPAFRGSADGAVQAARARPGAVAVWASRQPPGLADATAAAGVPLLLVEDGFLRSVGLGADFMPAASLVIDGGGIYYDPSQPSDLERLLADSVFADALTRRAGRLIDLLVARGITKYNTGGTVAPELGAPQGVRRILVPGQVEDDRSVALGGADVRGNLDLLTRTRAANPDAFIVYKPHPDVDAGHRRGAVPDEVAAGQADRVIRGVSSAALLAAVDEVHTLTSLVGFEGLLRRRRVVVYGLPFYAGWGLTADQTPLPRRSRRLTIEQLVAGALILYPRYLDPVTHLPCGPEVIIERLSDPSLWRAGPLVTLRRLQGAALRRLTGWSAALSARTARP